uniref:Thioredoxin domain-containing protein n=1 Tax=Plectus sambesii TaxID=2011161 RepID=A0A914XN90_9BILA
MLELLPCILFITVICSGKRVDYGYVPNGDNPTLYDAVEDPILQLDQDTFADTVYNASTAFGIEFYADWCGHCRKFAPKFKEFAHNVKEWKPVVKIAVLNCADPYNEQACAENGVVSYPTLKYFPRGSAGVQDGIEYKELNSSAVVLIDLLVERIEAEYAEQRYSNWPNIGLLGDESTYDDLWKGIPYSAHYLAIVFGENEEHHESVKLILDLSRYHNKLAIRRSNFTSKLAKIMKVTQSAVIVFKRDDSVLILNSRIGPDVHHKLENLATTGDSFLALSTTSTTTMATTTTMAPWSCKRNPDKCETLYFVSETDMLKAMRYALYNDVPRAGGNFTGHNLTALKDFLDLLVN